MRLRSDYYVRRLKKSSNKNQMFNPWELQSQFVEMSMDNSMIYWNYSRLEENHLKLIIFSLEIMLIEVIILLNVSLSYWLLKSDTQIESP